jgi:carboxypeptidase family protein
MRVLRLGALAAAVTFGARALPAQGRLHGVAFDSLLGRPLAGATVWLQDLNRSAFTDSSGRFTLDSVPAGRHVFLLAHPDLDSAGLGTVAAAITVARGVDVALAVPSIGTLWRRLCGREISGPDSAIVFGSVRDADSRVPLSGVTATVVWPRLHINDSLQLRVESLADSARTDSTGSYRVCGVATGMNVRAQAHAGPFATGVVQLTASTRPVARRDFTLSLTLQIADSGRGSSELRGRVRTEGGRPVPGAVVAIEGVDSTASDGEGRFALGRLPGGTQWLRVRAVGFGPLESAVDVPGSAAKTMDLELRSVTVVDTITVVATGRMARVLQELEERRKSGFGYALRQEEIQRRVTVRSVMQSVPSVNVQGNGLSFTVLMQGGSIMRGYCVADLRIDGVPATWDQMSTYQPQDLVAVEVYPRASLVPIRYQSISSGCGMVLVWTKNLQ